MNINKAQVTTAVFSGLLLLFLVLCPPWQEAEQNYRKDVGRGFLWSPPKTVSVDCYFSGCTTAPGSYFHPVLNRELLLKQAIPVLVVASIFLWLFRSRPGRQRPILETTKKRLAISLLLALLVPPTGGVPMAAALAIMPTLLVDRGEFWAAYVVMIPTMYLAFALGIFVLLSALHRIVLRPARVRGV